MQQATRMPIGRAFHGVAVLRDYVYAIGGAVSDPNLQGQFDSTSVYVARITPTGQLTQWVETTPLPQTRFYIGNSTLVLNDTVYVLGGSAEILGGARRDTVTWTRPLPNGKLMPWKESPPFAGSGVSAIAAFSTPGYLYVTGGNLGNNEISNRVYSLAILPDGAPGRWEESSPLPTPLWFHHAGVVGGRVYVWGGLATSAAASVSDRVFSSDILGSGKLSAWREEPAKLPVGFYSGSSANAGPYLFTFSPRYAAGVASSDAYWTVVSAQGMKPWQKNVTGLPMRLYHSAAADYRRGSIYFAGGRFDRGEEHGQLPWVVFFKLSESARRQAEEEWIAAETAHLSVSTSLAGEQPPATQPSATGAQEQDTSLSTGGLTQFQPYEVARSQSTGKPIIVYYRLSASKPCTEQDAILATANLADLTAKSILAVSDIRGTPQIAQQYGVWRSPTWIFYDSRGVERKRHVGIIQLDALRQYANALP